MNILDIDFDKLPKEANHIARDKSGELWWYARYPILTCLDWDPNGGAFGKIEEDWENSLVKLPERTAPK